MANRQEGKFTYVDTFTEDVVFSTGATRVHNITITNTTETDVQAVLINDDIYRAEAPIIVPAGRTISWPQGAPEVGMQFRKGLTLDISASTLVTGCFMTVRVS
jgi:hypothetical protein